MTKNAALFKNTVILGVGKFSSQLITFLMIPLYTRYLTPDEYGIVDLVVTYVILLAPAITLQMEMAVFRFLIDGREDEEWKAKVITNSLYIVFASLILASAVAFSFAILIDFTYFYLIVGIIISNVLSSFCMQCARGLGENLNFAIASILIGLTTVGFSVTLVIYLNLGPVGILLSMLIAHIVAIIYLLFSLKIHTYIRFGMGDKKFRKTLLKYSVPLVPNGISWWIINGADRTIITLVFGLASNGVYAIASKFPAIFTAIFAVFGMSWTESASLHINGKDRDKFFSATFDSAFRFFGTLGAGVIAALPFIFPLVVESSFQEAYLYIPLLMLGALFNALVGLYSAIYVAKKMTLKVANTSIMAAVISISLNLILISFIGIYAAAVANITAYLSMAIYRHYDLKKYLTISYDKWLILILVILYFIVIGCYYLNFFYINVFSLAIAIVFFVILNRSILSFLTLRLISRFKSSAN